MVFWNKGYDVIIFVLNVTNKILSLESNCIVDVVMWPKIGNCSIFIEVITSLCKDSTRKNTFFERWSWFKFNNLGLALSMTLKFYSSVGKGLKLKVRKIFGVNSYVCRSYRGRTGRKPFWHPSWIGLKASFEF